MNKIEFLRKLREEVEKEGVINARYWDYESGKCCAVGYVFRLFDQEFFEDYFGDEDNNKQYLSTLYNYSDQLKDAVHELNKETGITLKQLSLLQEANDGDYDSEEDRKQRVLWVIDGMLKYTKIGGMSL